MVLRPPRPAPLPRSDPRARGDTGCRALAVPPGRVRDTRQGRRLGRRLRLEPATRRSWRLRCARRPSSRSARGEQGRRLAGLRGSVAACGRPRRAFPSWWALGPRRRRSPDRRRPRRDPEPAPPRERALRLRRADQLPALPLALPAARARPCPVGAVAVGSRNTRGRRRERRTRLRHVPLRRAVRGLARSRAWRPGVLVAPLAAAGAAGLAGSGATRTPRTSTPALRAAAGERPLPARAADGERLSAAARLPLERAPEVPRDHRGGESAALRPRARPGSAGESAGALRPETVVLSAHGRSTAASRGCAARSRRCGRQASRRSSSSARRRTGRTGSRRRSSGRKEGSTASRRA